MKKKRIFLSTIIVIVGILLVLHYLLDPLRNPKVALDLKRGDVFKLKEDVFLYVYNNEKLSLLPKHFWVSKFTIDDFKKDPKVGIIDEKYNCYVRAIVPAGTHVEFTDIKRQLNWNGGNFDYTYLGKIISGDFKADSKLYIGRLLIKFGKDRIHQYMEKVEEE